MTNLTCQSIHQGQDCISRNARHLCDVCAALLSPEELREREAAQWVTGIKKHADYYMRELKTRCLTRSTWRHYSVPAKQGKCISVKFTRHLPDGLRPEPVHATCVQMRQKKICPGCVNSMNDSQLKEYWLTILRQQAEQEEQRQCNEWLQARAKASGWPFADHETLNSPAALAFGIFMVSSPCFLHAEPAA